MKKDLSTLLAALLLIGCRTATEPVDYVNPYIGSISHLLCPTYPTVQLPHGMLRVFPNRYDLTQEQVGGLPVVVTDHRSSSTFCLSPTLGTPQRVVHYNWDNEHCTPYSYSVSLDDHAIDARFAVSYQSALYEVIPCDASRPLSLILTSHNGEMSIDGRSASGYQWIGGPARAYVYMEVSCEPQTTTVLDGSSVCWTFAAGTSVQARYGVSFISIEQARANLEREQTSFSYDHLAAAGRQAWNEALSSIDVEGADDDSRAVFYTSYYRTFERPVCISEDGRYYSAYDNQVHDDEGHPFYADDWIWDTYRAAHPLRTLFNQQREEDILTSYIRMAGQSTDHWMPTFPGIMGDSHRMNSNHGVITVADAMAKGLSIDYAAAYQACRAAIEEKTLAPWSAHRASTIDAFYHTHGYIPALREDEPEYDPAVHGWERRQPVAVTLGTAYDQWALSLLADSLGYHDDYTRLHECSFNYRHLFHPATAFFHPKDSAGQWIEPFDYRFSGGVGARQYYDENNGWTYRWDVPHHIDDLVALMGGPDAFAHNLDATFNEGLGRNKYEFYHQLPDQTGNVGQFTMANEPSFHIPYLYNYAGKPWKTQQRIRQLLRLWFRNDLMGIPGDEDGGGMTSFVVFSSLGLYPVTPGLAVYNIGSPLFEKATLHLDGGNTFRIHAIGASADNKYIQSATLNGKPLDRAWLTHDEIMSGGTLTLTMSSTPNKAWGAATPPPSGR